MKKFILPLLLLLAIGMLAAVESDPSAVVGYFKVSVPQDSWVSVSYPFEIVSGTPTAIFGDNWDSTVDYEVTDMLFDPYSLTTANYYNGFGWDPNEDTYVQAGHWYWINRTQPQANTDVYLVGKVNPQPISLTMNGQGLGGWTPFAINDAAPISPELLGFVQTEPDWDNGIYDNIFCVTDNRMADYWGPEYGNWVAADGLPFLIEPTKTYLYYSNQASNWTWEYPSAKSYTPTTLQNQRRK
jgi:hypothetical protein